jgi:hypothetical protein
MVQLLFGESGIAVRRAISKGEDWLQFGIESEFLSEAASGGLHELFARPRMSAAGVRPESTEMVFCSGSLLEEHASIRSEEHNGKCAMQQAGARMGFQLVGCTDFFIAFVYEDDFFHD